jgi:tetratricopeptide (TPR) repeat protein
MDTVIENQPLSGPYYTYLQAVEAHLERADIAVRQERIQDARADLELVIALAPENLSQDDRANLDAQQQRAFERLALSYLQEEDSETAVKTLENARRQLPQLACTFTTNMAVSLYLSGQKDRALTELESIQDQVELEYTPICKMSLFYLGQLYLELGQTDQARTSLINFLTASEPFYDAQTRNLQEQANQLLAQISGQ